MTAVCVCLLPTAHARSPLQFVVTIRGDNFGVTAPSITVGGLPCAVVPPFQPSAGHNTITCVAPPGQGRDNLVSVTVNTLTTVPIVPSGADPAPDTLWYDPPLPASMWPLSELPLVAAGTLPLLYCHPLMQLRPPRAAPWAAPSLDLSATTSAHAW